MPIGLYEGLMGNSGAAISDPTAGSYYNPSLINKKQKDSYSINGNTLNSLTAKSNETEVSSFTFNPAYLSTIMVGDFMVHEFFIANLSPSKLNISSESVTSDDIIKFQQSRDQNQFLFGYTMAFQDIPFALSYFSQYNQIDTSSSFEQTSLTSNLRSTSFQKINYKSVGFGISASGYTTVDGYTLGYQLKTRQMLLYKSNKGLTKSYIHGGTTPTDYTVTESETKLSADDLISGNQITIGHGFKIGDHEFLTDSQFVESGLLNNTYSFHQTFGYRMNSDFGHQILCGLSHQIGPEVKYFGQDIYYSVGYSWLKRAFRTAFGAYAYSNKVRDEIFAVGLTFGSEFNY